MLAENLTISQPDMRKLLGAANADAALLYLYISSGNEAEKAEADLHMTESRMRCASAILRQLGMWPEVRQSRIAPGERPNYTEQDVTSALRTDSSFTMLYSDIQYRLGRQLNTEELKILLGFMRYLGMSTDLISILINYCQNRARRKGSQRNPSLRTIEKEAYLWAEKGIDTVEEAAAFINEQNLRQSRIGRIMDILQIRGRYLTPGEEKYAAGWIDMGFDDEVIAMAYERTCINTGGLNWAYMNKILQRWHQNNLHTAAAVQEGDRKGPVPKGASGQLGQAELEAIQKLLQEG